MMMRILTILLLSLFGSQALAQVSAQLDKNPALVGEMLTLSIRSESGGDELDLSVLDADFQVLGRSSSSQIQMINGSFSRSHDWIIQLRPKRVGELIIPPITVGKHKTQAIRLSVREPQRLPGEQPEAFIEFETSKDAVYLREELLVTARLFVRGQLLSGSFSDPAASNAVIEQLGEQQESQRLLGPHRYRVIERRYVIYPESSGTLNIQAPVFSGELATGQQSRSLFGFSGGRRAVYAAPADPLQITVKPQPATYTAKHWLPAGHVEINETLNPAQGPYRAGEPLTRTITLQVDGQLHTQLPALDWPAPAGAQQYTEAPQDQTLAGANGLSAVRSYSVAIIPQAGGELLLPEVHLSWWDTDQDRQRETVLPARRLNIAAIPTLNTPPASQPLPAAATEPAISSDTTLASAPADEVNLWPWQLATLTALAGWIGTLLAWWWQHRQHRQTATAGDASAEPNRRELLRILQQGDARSCHQALLHWARPVLPAGAGLQALAGFDDSGELATAIRALDAAAFGQAGAQELPRETLIGFVKRFRYPVGKTNPRDTGPALPPLYPTAR